ncbi:mannose-1-phosphate guanylyltransferase/mannose-6-phosphate isomerase [Luminiphilus syltensis NOR5-1B]|uniref:mannose-1-phosphate guanylyltransferase n=1 Tax=Luminiphilus syltensis NOR5-1B TaxID=565045 RepID=B8KWJ8_9GAMM|nr:mannose-1-phosphate guanylyltransferase/mannose-6-phosphate isomerase [Luminiphilus syltensis]EED36661.1 mannose-1-phosphate guanylyltransferase/mannose-6-phosphate isomerase [Luminiphilus syltensis NOR5-1B]
MTLTVTPVLLCGGVGSRLWPMSREGRPKQFLPLGGDGSMLQQTCQRLDAVSATDPLIVCNDEHRFLVAEQLREINAEAAAIILEPVGRNTAPAIALAALHAIKENPEALLLVLPADHFIADVDAFAAAVTKAAVVAAEGALVTFGVVPDRPETGYGYIRSGELLADDIYAVDQFVEKPTAEIAEQYLAAGIYRWNSGMFLFRADGFLRALSQSAPEIESACEAAMNRAAIDLDFIRPDKAIFEACPSDSIDYAVMEHTGSGAVVSLDCGWSDIGAWDALWAIGHADDDGNVLSGDVLLDDVRGSYVRSDSRLVAATGVDNLVIVETADAVMVAHRDHAQGVKRLVSRLKSDARPEASVHQRVYRPWGSYESLIVADRFQVKRIVVNPGGKLSLQKHYHRAEHWVVVHGTAEVTRGDEVIMLHEDESTYLPMGMKHRLVNPGRIPLELIEVQSGSYLGEDDIVRYDDIYGR